MTLAYSFKLDSHFLGAIRVNQLLNSIRFSDLLAVAREVIATLKP